MKINTYVLLIMFSIVLIFSYTSQIHAQSPEDLKETIKKYDTYIARAKVEIQLAKDRFIYQPTEENRKKYNEWVSKYRKMQKDFLAMENAVKEYEEAYSFWKLYAEPFKETVYDIQAIFTEKDRELYGDNWKTINSQYEQLRKKQKELINRRNDLMAHPEKVQEIKQLKKEIAELKQKYEIVRQMIRVEQQALPYSTILWGEERFGRYMKNLYDHFDTGGVLSNALLAFFGAGNIKFFYDAVKPMILSQVSEYYVPPYGNLTYRIADSIVLDIMMAGPGDFRTAAENVSDAATTSGTKWFLEKILPKIKDKLYQKAKKDIEKTIGDCLYEHISEILKNFPYEQFPRAGTDEFAEKMAKFINSQQTRTKLIKKAEKKWADKLSKSLEKEAEKLSKKTGENLTKKSPYGSVLDNIGILADIIQEAATLYAFSDMLRDSLDQANHMCGKTREKYREYVKQGKIDNEISEDQCVEMVYFKEGECFPEKEKDDDETKEDDEKTPEDKIKEEKDKQIEQKKKKEEDKEKLSLKERFDRLILALEEFIERLSKQRKDNDAIVKKAEDCRNELQNLIRFGSSGGLSPNDPSLDEEAKKRIAQGNEEMRKKLERFSKSEDLSNEYHRIRECFNKLDKERKEKNNIIDNKIHEARQVIERLKDEHRLKSILSMPDMALVTLNAQEKIIKDTYANFGELVVKPDCISEFCSPKQAVEEPKTIKEDSKQQDISDNKTVSATISDLNSKEYFGTSKDISLSLTGNSDSDITIVWHSSPNLTFKPEKSSGLSTTVTFDRMQNPTRIWANIMKGHETIGESEQVEIEVISPKYELIFEPPADKVKLKQPVKVTIKATPPPVDEKIVDYRWVEPTDRKELTKTSIEIIPVKTDPIKLHAIARVPAVGDTVNDDIRDEFKAVFLEVIAKVLGAKYDKPVMVWNNKTGMAQETKQFAVHQDILVQATVKDIEKDKVTYQWSVNEDSHIVAGIRSEVVTVNRSQVGTCVAKVVVSDKEGNKLGEAEVSFEVPISQADMDMAIEGDKAKQAKEKLAEAKKDYSSGNLDDALEKAEDAMNLDPKNTEAKSLYNKIKSEKERYMDMANQAKTLIDQYKLDEAQFLMGKIPSNILRYPPIKEIFDSITQARTDKNELIRNLQKEVEQAIDLANQCKYDEAIMQYESIIEKDPFKDTQKPSTSAENQLMWAKKNKDTIDSYMQKAKADMERGDYKSARTNAGYAYFNKSCKEPAELLALIEKEEKNKNQTMANQSNNVVPIAPVTPQGNVVPIAPGVPQGNVVPIAPVASQSNVVPIAQGLPQSNVVPIAPGVSQGNVVPIAQGLPQGNVVPFVPQQQQVMATPAQMPPSGRNINDVFDSVINQVQTNKASYNQKRNVNIAGDPGQSLQITYDTSLNNNNSGSTGMMDRLKDLSQKTAHPGSRQTSSSGGPCSTPCNNKTAVKQPSTSQCVTSATQHKVNTNYRGSKRITVQATNRSSNNVHIFKQGESFGPGNRFNPGQTKTLTLNIVSGQIYLQAGRNGTVLANTLINYGGVNNNDLLKVYFEDPSSLYIKEYCLSSSGSSASSSPVSTKSSPVAGRWSINANNYTGILEITGSGSGLSARIYYDIAKKWETLADVRYNSATGDISFRRPWAGNPNFQLYKGKINGNQISGTFKDNNSPNNTYYWKGSKQ